MSKKLVLFPPVDSDRLKKIHEAAGSMRVVNCLDEAEALHEIVDADALFGKITPTLLASATRLTWVQSATASLEHYVFPALVEHPCTLTNMRGLFSDVIADHVFGYILTFARNLHRYLRQQIQHRWAPVGGENQRSNFSGGPHFVSGMDRAHMHVGDCTLGIVGLGAIGAEVARRGHAFNMKVVAVDPVVDVAPPEVDSLLPPDRLDQLLAVSDFVVICAPHTPDTERLFRRERFEQMKPGSYLINIGRGAIVVLDDLVDALRSRHLAGAALDVFQIEPLPTDHPLWDFENVIITPHVAACSVHIAERHLATLLDNIRRFVSDQTLVNVVNKAKWY